MKKEREKGPNIHRLWNSYKKCDVYNENTRRRRDKGTEGIFKAIISKNFSKLMIDNKSQIQEAKAG